MEVIFAATRTVPQTLQNPGVVPIYLGCPGAYPGHASEFLLVVSARPSHAESGRGARYTFAVVLWGMLALRSEAWRALYNRMPYETTPRQAQKVLAECPPAFAIPARQCLELAQHISQEFTEDTSRHELDALIKQYRPPGTRPSDAAPACPTLWDT